MFKKLFASIANALKPLKPLNTYSVGYSGAGVAIGTVLVTLAQHGVDSLLGSHPNTVTNALQDGVNAYVGSGFALPAATAAILAAFVGRAPQV